MLKNVLIIVLSCLTQVIYAQLNGTVTVPGTYPTLAAAINDLNSNGISGVTTIEVSANQTAPSGGYVINAVAGSSVTNTLTIKAIGAIVLTAPTGTSTTIDGVIKLNGADNLTIEGFTIAENALNTTQTTQMEWGIAALNVSTTDACQNITIKNCSINLNGAVENANEVGIYAVHHSITSIFALRPTSASGAFSNLKIVGCTIDNAYTGILVGYNGTNTFPETNLIIGENGAGNTITNFGGSSAQSTGIYVDWASNANVNYNTIDNTLLNTQTYGLDGIFVGNGANQNITISYNTIKVRKTNLTSQLTAIRNLGYTGTVICNNNEITGCSADGSGTIILIYNQVACANLTVNNNNIHDNAGLNTTGTVALCYSNGAVANLTFNNNTLSNNQKSTVTTGNFYGFGNVGKAANGVETVKNNTITNLGNITFQGTLYGFYSSTVTTQSRTMSENTINGLYGNNEIYAMSVLNNNLSTLKFNKITNITSNAGIVYGVYALSNNFLTCTDNKISNIVIGGTFYGISSGSVNGSTISKDTLTNVTGTNGTNSCQGFGIGYGANNQINGCVINNINGVGKFTGLFLGGSITTNAYDNSIKNVVQTTAATTNGIDAIFLTQSLSNCVYTIYNNTIDSLTNRSSTTGNTNGILVNNAKRVNIYKNKITNLRNEFSTTNRVNGINIAACNIANVYNNDIFNLFSGMSTDFACLNGLCISTGTGDYKFYNNTIRLSGNVFGGANGLAILAAAAVDYTNNIFNINVTAPTAFQVSAIRKHTTALLASTTNNNLYYVPNNSNAFYYIESNAAVFQRGFSPNATPTQGISDLNFNQACSIYKSYMLGKESTSFYENTTFNESIPTGTTFAESRGQSITLVTQDFTGATRGATPDIGAYEFSGIGITTDIIGPTIAFSTIPNVICTNNIPISVNITDASGIKTATNKPRLWFKKTTEKDSLAANNTAAYNGWKYVEATNTTTPFLFNLDLSVLNTPAVAGNIIQLFVTAEDNNGNVGASRVSFNNGFCASSVALDATAFPTQSMTPILTFSVIAAPASINTIASKSIICVSSTVDLSLSSATLLNLEYQWQGSATVNGTFVDIPSATSTTLTTTVNSTSHKAFRCQLKCGTTVILASTPISIEVLNPQVLSTSPASRCDAGTLNLAVTPSSGSTVNWYDAATGENPIANNSSLFTTPSLSVSKNYYAEAVSTSVNKQSFANDGGWNHITTDGEFQFNLISDDRFMVLTLQEPKRLSSLDIYPGAAIGNQYIIQARINNQYGPVVATYTGNTTVRCFYSSLIPQTVNVDWLLPAGTYYIGFAQNPYCWRSGSAEHAYPWTLDDNSASIYAQLSTFYQYYFYNFKFNKVCTSARVPVAATINDCPKISTKVLLSNANPTTRKMDDYVKSLPSFPLTDPYAAANAFSGNFTHVNKTTLSTVSPSVLAVTGDNAIVDWMFLELRKGTSGATTVTHTQVGLLQKDGDVVAMDGVSPVQFNAPTDNYYITMRHRNHLGFRTNAAYALSNSVTTLDFTNNTVALYGALPINQITPTLSIMNGGDANSDGSIDAFDSISWEMQNGLFDDYLQNADYNMDGSIDALDSIVWEFNNGKYQELD
jgi:hypothetical protein